MTFLEFIQMGLFSQLLEKYSSSSIGAAIFFGGFLICIIGGYLLGSVNMAIVISKQKYGADVRDSGSKNAGTTNMLRTYGEDAAKLTFIGDIGKTVLSALLGYTVFGIQGAYFACLMCIVGHIFPIYYRFRGGKGVACAAAMILCLDPIAFLIIAFVFFVILFGMKYVSLASIMAAMMYPMVHRWTNTVGFMREIYFPYSTTFTVIVAILILWRHYPNMKRLWDKTESKTDIIAKIKAKKQASETENGK